MVLGLGSGELVIVVGVSALLFGPKDLHKIARFGGKSVGWAVGYLKLARGQLQDISGNSEMIKIHREMQETMHQLRCIQDDVKRGARLLNPASTVRDSWNQEELNNGRILGNVNTVSQSNDAPQTLDSQNHTLGPVGEILNRNTSRSGGAIGFAGSGVEPTRASDGSIDSHMRTPGYVCNNRDFHHSGARSAHKLFQGQGEKMSQIPVSAVSAGLIKDVAKTGSDIIVDALLEEQVAGQAQEFLEVTMERS